jgi:hypothetical protein
MEGGTEITKEPLERIADALEKLASDPEIEMEVGPPICPSCGKLNPTMVLPPQEGGRGPMAELIVDGACGHCGMNIFIVIESYSVHKTGQTAAHEIEARREAGVFSGNVQ